MASQAKKFTINVKHGNDNKPYTVPEDTTVAKLKEMIGKEVGYPADELQLVWAGKNIDDKATMKETQLQDGTMVTLVLVVPERPPRPKDMIEIFVKTPQDTTITIDVLPTTLVKDIRKQIHDKTGVQPEFQRLIFGGKTLEDERDGKECTLADYQIQQGGSTVHMVLRLLGGLSL